MACLYLAWGLYLFMFYFWIQKLLLLLFICVGSWNTIMSRNVILSSSEITSCSFFILALIILSWNLVMALNAFLHRICLLFSSMVLVLIWFCSFYSKLQLIYNLVIIVKKNITSLIPFYLTRLLNKYKYKIIKMYQEKRNGMERLCCHVLNCQRCDGS